MAEGRPIQKSDLIEPGIIQSLINELKGLKVTFSQATTDKSADIEKTNKAFYDTVEVTKDLITLQKDEIRIQGQINKLKEQGIKISAADKVELTKLKEQLKQVNRELNTEARLTNQVGTSMNQLSQALARNKQEYRKLTAEQRKNDKGAKNLLKTIQKQDKEIKRLDKTLGDNQRNVGNYGSALEGVVGQFSGLGGVMPKVAAGIKVVKNGFGSLKAVIMTSGIGTLVIALISLINYFKNTEEGAIKLKRIMVPLEATWNTMVETAKRLGEVLSRIFDQNILTTWEQMKEVTADTNNLYKEQHRLVSNLATIDQLQHQVRVKNITKLAEIERDVAKARLIANDDTNYSLEQQSIAIKEAIALTNELYDIKLTELKLAKAKAELDSQTGTNSREEQIALEEAIAAVIRVEAERDNALRTITRRQTTLTNKERTALIEKQVTEVKIQEEREETLEQFFKREEDLVGKSLENFVDAEKAKAQAAIDAEQLRLEAQDRIYESTNQALSASLKLVEDSTAEYKILATAQATLNAYLAATQALTDFATLSAPAKIAAAIATLAVGLGWVSQMKAVGFAEGTDSVEGGIKGKDSVNAMLMPEEMILTRKEGAVVRGLGFGHKDVPGMVALGKQANNLTPDMLRLAGNQLHETAKTNKMLGKLCWVDPKGIVYDLRGNKRQYVD